MQIIEQTIVPKNPKRKSEDGIVVTDDFIAVIDGSTSKSSRRYSRNNTNGRYAMLLVSKYVEKMPADSTCHAFCTGVTRSFHNAMCGRSLSPATWLHPTTELPGPVDRLAASAVIFSRLRREIWMVGDCLCMVNGQLFENPKPFEDVLARQRADIISRSDNHQQFLVNDTARQQILPEMMRVMQEQQNVAYAVIDGAPIAERHVLILPLDFQPKELVLATDGYPFLHPTLEASEAALAHQLATDPLNIGAFKATKACMQGNKSFDDRAYIRFKV